MSARKLTPDEDKALWVDTRLTYSARPYVTLARRRALEQAYDRLTEHAAPANVHRYGQRLSGTGASAQ